MVSTTALEFGLISHLRTGNALLDTLLCLLVPVLSQQVIQSDSMLRRLLRRLLQRNTARYKTRSIELTQRFNKYGLMYDGEQTNHYLQKAVALHLAQVLEFQNKDARYELLERPVLLPSKTKRLKALCNSDDEQDVDDVLSESTHCSSDDEEEESGSDESTDWSVYEEIENLRVRALPPLNKWFPVEDGIEFMHQVIEESDEQNGGGNQSKAGTPMKESKIIYHFRTLEHDGTTRIDDLIDRAFRKYKLIERAKVISDTSRYMYMRSTHSAKSNNGGDDDAGKSAVAVYKRYRLGEEKTFENLFFHGKPQVLQLLDNFMNRTGKFAIKGFPYKLGLLLHGPPGTGKTSLIKAIAQYTKRHIVNVPLSMIKTNEELQDAMFDLRFSVDELDLPVKMRFQDVVFVMEDVDCASSIVNTRQDKDKDKDKNEGDNKPPTLQRTEESLISNLLGLTDDGTGVKSKTARGSGSDQLNLSGLLNVLDGVIDAPGRIVIMTTNHPEKLDPALIRPGRVNKKLWLGYMGVEEVQAMIEYYFSTLLSDDDKSRLTRVMASRGAQWTPAEIEEFCAEFETVEELLAHCEEELLKCSSGD